MHYASIGVFKVNPDRDELSSVFICIPECFVECKCVLHTTGDSGQKTLLNVSLDHSILYHEVLKVPRYHGKVELSITVCQRNIPE